MTDFDWDAFTGRTDRRTFQRHPHTGAPYVDHPSRVTKKGAAARVQYGRPSSAYSQIDQQFNLMKWSERMTLVGAIRLMVTGEVLPDDLDVIAEYDNDDPDHRRALDALVVRAREAAEADIAARRGTYVHELTELHDEDRDVLARLADGETLGIPVEVVDAVLDCWAQMLDQYGLEVLDVELMVVDDEFCLAGTLDRVARLTRDITLPTAKGFVVIPAGTVIVLDVKTGQLRLDRAGVPSYWHGYALQIASYAQARRYVIDDDGTEYRGRWHRRPSQEHAVIAHIDIAGALDTGVVTGRLVYVNLAAGREAGRLVRRAKHFGKRTDVIGIATNPTTSVTISPSP